MAPFPVFRAVRIRRSAMDPLDLFPVFWTERIRRSTEDPLGPVPVVWTVHRCTIRPHCPQQYRRRRSAHTTFLVWPTVPFLRVSRALELKIVLGVNEHHPSKDFGVEESLRAKLLL